MDVSPNSDCESGARPASYGRLRGIDEVFSAASLAPCNPARTLGSWFALTPSSARP